jgi:hypothetical protein
MTPESFGLDNPQLAIIQLSKRLALELIEKHHVRLRALLLDATQTYLTIAEELIPESVVISIGGAQTIIHNAAKKILSEQEHREVTFERQSRIGKLNGVNTGLGNSESLRKSIEARGEIPWSNDERILLLELINSPDFQHPAESSNKGQPDYALILPIINDAFHDGDPVRTLETIRTMRTHFLNKANPDREKRRQILWSTDEAQRLEELIKTCFRNNDQARGPDFILITQILNKEFHHDQFSAGIIVRKPDDCCQKLEQLGTERIKVRRTPWPDAESKRLLELGGMSTEKGVSKYLYIAENLNNEFHAIELAKGNEVRTASTCKSTLKNLRRKLKN